VAFSASQEALKHALRTAFTDLEKVAEKFKDSVDKDKLGVKLRTRSRNIPTLMFDTGLLPTLTFLWAKAGNETYAKIYNLLEKGASHSKKDAQGSKEEKAPSLEELSYSLYLYGVLKFMEAKRLIKNTSDPKNAVDELVEKGATAIVTSLRVLEPYLIELKKLCEAAYEEERE